jgi:prepilin-type processing-associated H-X9-DG protein
LALAVHAFHDQMRTLPAGGFSNRPQNRMPYSTWAVALLPYMEHEGLFNEVEAAYESDPRPFNNPPHGAIAQPLRSVQCPLDDRSHSIQITRRNRAVALTSYLGVSGTDLLRQDGVLFLDSAIKLADVLDGTSQTLLLGERPASPDFYYGWWYAGVGQDRSGSLNSVLGVCEMNVFADQYGSCRSGPYVFQSGHFDEPCDRFHFWSFHDGGANFALCDGAVRFFQYSSAVVLNALATRGRGEPAVLP